MCGRLNVTDCEGVRALMEELQIRLWPETGPIFSRVITAANTVSIVFENAHGQREMHNALWWLLLEPRISNGTVVDFKPSKYTSFNTRYDKLNVKRTAGYQSFRSMRCVIPAAGFGETEGKGSQARYTDFTVFAQDKPPHAMAMGGLYRIWQYKGQDNTNHYKVSCSVVTLPAHPKMEKYHSKSSPLVLSHNDGSIDTWLDSGLTDTRALAWLLKPKLRHSLVAHPIVRPTQPESVGEDTLLMADN